MIKLKKKVAFYGPLYFYYLIQAARMAGKFCSIERKSFCTKCQDKIENLRTVVSDVQQIELDLIVYEGLAVCAVQMKVFVPRTHFVSLSSELFRNKPDF